MALPDVSTTILDGALGLSTQDISAISAAVGIASSGTANAIVSITRPRDASTSFGTGPLPEKIAYHVQHSKKPVYGVRVAQSTAPTTSAVTKSNVSSPTLAVSGNARDTYSVIVEITQTGAVGDAIGSGAFRYSVDGGDADSPEIAIPAGGAWTAATVTGTGDLSVGALYGGGGTLDGLTVIINFNNTSPVTCTFVAPANKAAVLSQLNAAFGGTHFTAPGNFLVIDSTTTGTAGEIDITGGTALAALGLSVSTTNGTEPAATYAISGTGLTLSLPTGTYTDGDTYTFTTTEPYYNLTNLQAALDALLADNSKEWFVCHIVGAPATEADARALADVLATYGDDFAAVHRFVWFVMETEAATNLTTLKTEFADFESTRVAVSYGVCELTSELTKDNLTKRVYERPWAWPVVARWASVTISEKASFVGRGKMAGVVSVAQATLDNAEDAADARFLAAREVIGKTGYFLVEDCMMAPVGSDFEIAPYRRIMDVACRVARERLINYVQGRVLVDATTGFIKEAYAQAVESDVETALRDELVSPTPAHASSVDVVVTRDNDILRDEEMLVETRVVPPGYSRDIVHTIGFINPRTVTS